MAVNYRLGSDVDGDGFINWGVTSDAPPNLFPGALYTGQSKLLGKQYTTEADVFEDVIDISAQGFMKRQVKLGHEVAGDYAENIYFGRPADQIYKPYQQRANDPENLITDALNWLITGVTISGTTSTEYEPFGDTYGRFRVSPNMASSVPNGAGDYFAVGHAGTYPTGRGFHDGPLQYSRAVTADIVSDGFPVTAGQSYTFIYVLRKSGSDVVTYVRAYGNNGVSGTPSFGRVYLAGANYTSVEANDTPQYTAGVAGGTNFKTKYGALTFTVPVGTTHVFFDFQGGGNMLLGGLMLLEGTHSLPNRFWDSSIGFDERSTPFVLANNSPYVLSFWVKSPDGLDSLEGTQIITELNTATNVVETASSIPLTSDWVRHDITFPAAAYLRGFSFEWTGEKGGNPTGLDNIGTVEFKGFMLTEGDVIWPYHAGESYGFDDLTEYVLSIDTKSGKNNFHESLAYEGTMEVVLNNEDRLFSPENIDSPFHNVLNNDRRTLLQYWDGAEWLPLWTGWSTAIALTPGTNSDNRATLTCEQGMFRLREGSFSAPLTENVKIDALILLLLENSGWRSAVVPFQSTVGFGAHVDENFFILDTDLMIGQLDEGINLLELVGQDWGRKGNIEAALKEVLLSENASFWLDRDGRIVVVNRDYWVRPQTPVELNFDTDVQRGEYVYGQTITNRAEIVINRKRVEEDAAVWKTHRAFKVIPQKNPTDRVEIEIHAERVEGRQKTVIDYTLDNMVKTVYSEDPGIDYLVEKMASTEVKDKVIIELIPFSSGNIYRLRVTNTNAVPVWIDIELKGTLLNTEDGTPVIIEDEDAIEQQEAVHSIKLTSNVLSYETQAQSMGGFYLLRDAQPAGEFVRFEMNDAAHEIDLDKLGALRIGAKLSISETQSCQDEVIHWIIGENFSISGNVFIARYTSARTIPGRFMVIGDDLQNNTVNAVEDWTNVQTIEGNEVVYEDGKLVFTINAPLPLYLDPVPDQIVQYPVGLWNASHLKPRSEVTNIFDSYVGEMFANSPQDYGADATVLSRFIVLEANRKYRTHMAGGTQARAFIYGPIGVNASVVIKAFADAINHNFMAGYYDSDDWTLPADPSGSNHLSGYLNVFLPTPHAGRELIGSSVTFVRMSNNAATTLDDTVSHEYSLFARADADTTVPATMVLTVYDYAGVAIGSDSKVMTTTLQKWGVTIPSGNKAVWATFERTPFGEGVTTALIYGYGATVDPVSDYSELHAAQDQSIVYP